MMSIWEELKSSWPIIVTLGGLLGAAIGSWFWLQNSQISHTEKINKLELNATQAQKDISEVKDRVGNIQVAMEFIQKDMKEMKDLLFSLLKSKIKN